MDKLPLISLFSGAMGLDIGLERAGFEVRVAVENDPCALKTIRSNRPNLPIIPKDIREVSGPELLEAAGLSPGEAALVAGGPCCQAFSLVGNRGSMGDPRGDLFLHYIRLVEEIKPDFYLIENVRGLVSAAVKHRPLSQRTPDYPPLSKDEIHGSAFSLVLEKLSSLGGTVSVDIVNSLDHGSAQKRERIIIIGSQKSLTPPQLKNRSVKAGTLFDVIGEEKEETPIVVNIPPALAPYVPLIPPGGNWRSLPHEKQKEAIGEGAYYSWGGRTGYLRRLAWDKPCPTLTCSPTSRATMLLHPDEDRVLSVGEYRKIQGFPEDWHFCGGIRKQYMQIGNAVPVQLGASIGKKLYEALGASKSSHRPKSRKANVFTYNKTFFDRLKRMKLTTLSPNTRKVHGVDAVRGWLDKAEAGSRPSELIASAGGEDE